jgi:hypothetical protein
MLYKRAYAPMSRSDVLKIHDSGRRVKALESIIQRSLQANLRTTALLAQRQAEELRREIYQTYDIHI